MRHTKSSRIRRISVSLVVGGAMVALLFSSPAGGGTAAHAVDLPTWDDVQAAKQNEATAAAKVQEIEQLIAQSEAELERLRTATETANAKWQEAETAAEEAAQRAQELETEASASREEAERPLIKRATSSPSSTAPGASTTARKCSSRPTPKPPMPC